MIVFPTELMPQEFQRALLPQTCPDYGFSWPSCSSTGRNCRVTFIQHLWSCDCHVTFNQYLWFCDSCDCHVTVMWLNFPPPSNAKALCCSTWKYSWVCGCSVWQIFLTCSESKTLVWGHFMHMKHLPCLWCKGISLYGNFFLLFVALGRSASGRKGCHCGCQQFQVS